MAKLEDMRIFARVAVAGSYTGAARLLGMPKQTVSRRMAELEAELGVPLIQRTTRRLRLTENGLAFAERCAEVVRLADEAVEYIKTTVASPRGNLRITADRLFGDCFLGPLVARYAQRYPEVGLEVMLTPRVVDLVEEGFDVGFRVGQSEAPGLVSVALGKAEICYCASPDYLLAFGEPTEPLQLRHHQCIIDNHDHWPFRGVGRVAVTGRLRFNSFPMVRQAVTAGLGIGLFPAFACQTELASGQLVKLLEDWVPEVGSVYLVFPSHRYQAARLRAFVELALEEFQAHPPWL